MKAHLTVGARTFGCIHLGRTCTFLCINQTAQTLSHVHIGDSGYLLFRKEGNEYKTIYKSEDMLHDFNFPFQVGENGDDPFLANVSTHNISVGDVIVLATDGLWDNVESEYIRKIMPNLTSSDGIIRNTTQVAELLAQEASRLAHSK